MSPYSKARTQLDPTQFIEQEIKSFAAISPANRMPFATDQNIFDEPLVRFADGDDAILTRCKIIIAPTHLTPKEALAKAYDRRPEDVATPLSVVSWILPICSNTRESSRRETRIPSRPWAYTRWYGEKFNDALRKHLVQVLTELGYLAVAPVSEPYFRLDSDEKGRYSNWSERHIAYAAGHGTFSLSDGFIAECGIAHRCGSVITSLNLPPSPRIAQNPYSNCLFYVDGSCKACIKRCPAGAITEEGHDKIRCEAYSHDDIGYLKREYGVEKAGCGLCQVKVPCEFQNPTRK